MIWFVPSSGLPYPQYIDGLMQKRRNSSALAMELRLFSIKPSMYAMAWVRRDRHLESSVHHLERRQTTFFLLFVDCCKGYVVRVYDLSPQWIFSYLPRLPWIFPGAPLKVNGAPGNIQGNLTTLSLVWGCERRLTLLCRVSPGLRSDAGYSRCDNAMQCQGCTGQGGDGGLYNDVMMSAMAFQFTSLTIVYSTVYSRRRSQKTSKFRVTGLCAQRANNAEMFPFDDVIMDNPRLLIKLCVTSCYYEKQSHLSGTPMGLDCSDKYFLWNRNSAMDNHKTILQNMTHMRYHPHIL